MRIEFILEQLFAQFVESFEFQFVIKPAIVFILKLLGIEFQQPNVKLELAAIKQSAKQQPPQHLAVEPA